MTAAPISPRRRRAVLARSTAQVLLRRTTIGLGAGAVVGTGVMVAALEHASAQASTPAPGTSNPSGSVTPDQVDPGNGGYLPPDSLSGGSQQNVAPQQGNNFGPGFGGATTSGGSHH